MGSLLEILAVALVCGVLSQPGFGQVLGANVGGIVVDESGASVPGVTITSHRADHVSGARYAGIENFIRHS